MERYEGTPQGGPLSPLLANVLLDEVDRELERRGHRFVRYADDCNVYVRSQRAGERVLAGLRKLYDRLHLKVNEAKTAVARAFGRKFLGYSLWRSPGGEVKRAVAAQGDGDLQAAHSADDATLVAGAAWPRWRSSCGATCRVGRRTSGWRRRPGVPRTRRMAAPPAARPAAQALAARYDDVSASCGPWGPPDHGQPCASRATAGAGGVTAASR